MTNELSNEEAAADLFKLAGNELLGRRRREALRMGAEALRALTWQPVARVNSDGFIVELDDLCLGTGLTLYAPQPQGESN